VSKVSPTGRSLKLLRSEGWTVAVVERWDDRLKIRRDLWGWADIIGCHRRLGETILVQTTTSVNLSARIKKAKAVPALLHWLEAGNGAEFHGWWFSKRLKVWTVKRVRIVAGEIDRKAIIPRRPNRRVKPGLFA
jgi:hypothetical protein